jgi:lipoprotein-anchoring transpeptidase ErfK/SrfK
MRGPLAHPGPWVEGGHTAIVRTVRSGHVASRVIAAAWASAALAASASAAAPPATYQATPPRPVAIGAPTAKSAWIGRLLIASSARVRPDRRARAITVLQPVAPLGGGPTSLLVTGTRRDATGRLWVRILLPVRPNGAQGWVAADAFRFVRTPLRVVIDQTDRRLTLYRRGRILFRFPVAVGKSETPTPTGRFAVAEMIRTHTPGAFLGPVVFPLTGYSKVLNEYAGGNGRVAMHGTSIPSLIGTRASHGCIRMRNADVVHLSRLIRPGVPVTIRW